MTRCERCGTDIPDNVAICPSCGTITASAQSTPRTNYGPPTGNFARPQQPDEGTYQRGYSASPGDAPAPPAYGYTPPQAQPQPQPQPGYGYMPPQPGYAPPQQQQQHVYGYAPSSYPPAGVNVTVVNASPMQKNNGALIAEIILSIFGIYGVGWLIAGETTIGVILLICSFVLIWPVAVLFFIFTLGLGTLCVFPLSIAGIVINAILLNNNLNRKFQAQQVLVQTNSRMY